MADKVLFEEILKEYAQLLSMKELTGKKIIEDYLNEKIVEIGSINLQLESEIRQNNVILEVIDILKDTLGLPSKVLRGDLEVIEGHSEVIEGDARRLKSAGLIEKKD